MSQTIYWCPYCNVPTLFEECNLCGSKCFILSKDLKPVFPGEREILVRELSKYVKKNIKLPSVLFRSNNRVFYNGKLLFTFRIINNKLSFSLKTKPETLAFDEEEISFNEYIERVVRASEERIKEKEKEAVDIIMKAKEKYDNLPVFVSFSGGKDSSIVAFLVNKVLGKTPLIFSNTSMEFPETVDFAKRFANKLGTKLIELKPNRDFFDLCKELGPPSRVMRWCCFTQKSAPINDFYTSLGSDILSFDGIRKKESRSRSKFEPIRKNTKIIHQYSAYPIFYWSDFEVWLYIFYKKIEVNPLYFFGYSRVGCWTCPNNSMFDEFLTSKTHPRLYEKWLNFLMEYARVHGKTRDWVYEGLWKERKTKYNKIKIGYATKICDKDVDSFVINLNGKKKVDEKIINFLQIFGDKGISRKGKLVEIKGGRLSIRTFIGGNKILLSLYASSGISRILRYIIIQLEKAMNCVDCGACISTCPFNAIRVISGKVIIDGRLCRHCFQCASSKYLKMGCVSRHYKSERLTLGDFILNSSMNKSLLKSQSFYKTS